MEKAEDDGRSLIRFLHIRFPQSKSIHTTLMIQICTYLAIPIANHYLSLTTTRPSHRPCELTYPPYHRDISQPDLRTELSIIATILVSSLSPEAAN